MNKHNFAISNCNFSYYKDNAPSKLLESDNGKFKTKTEKGVSYCLTSVISMQNQLDIT